uniref:Uncharacterized protein n=1 Tax=Arundo donax TaxID=35708 RepID=A0A0A9C7N4_ARUDO
MTADPRGAKLLRGDESATT